jgi:hypothetical protein
LVEWVSERNWGEDREVAPAGRPMPAGDRGALPPPFLVYKRRLYVLAKKAPVLDHRQASIDDIFGGVERPRPRPVHQVRRPGAQQAVRSPVTCARQPGVKGPARVTSHPSPRQVPRFVPRNRLAQSV